MNWNNLGTVLHCPNCGNPFNDQCAVSNDPYYDLGCGPGVQGVNHHDAVEARRRVLAEPFQGTAWDAPEANDCVKCDKCGRVEPMAGWLLDHKFDEPMWPKAVEILTADDVGAKPRADQQRIVERAAELDEIEDEEKI
jgi:hypothetical protein